MPLHCMPFSWSIWESATLYAILYVLLISSGVKSQVITYDGQNHSIEYNPLLTDNGWSTGDNIKNDPTDVKFTFLSEATARLQFNGTGIQMTARPSSTFAVLDVTLFNADSTSINYTTIDDFRVSGANGQQNKTVTLFDNLSSNTYTIEIQKTTSGPGSDDKSYWGILQLDVTQAPPSLPSIDSLYSTLGTVTTPLSSTPAAMTTSQLAESGKPTSKIGIGVKVGVAIGSIIGIIIIGILVFLLYRRRKKVLSLAPDPLVITPSQSRQDRSRFRRMYSTRLPHFRAPSSIWPTSSGREVLPAAHPSSVTREPLHEKITPYSLPKPEPMVLKPSPPQHRHRKRRYTSFFVANPSSLSSQSQRSHSSDNHKTRREYEALQTTAVHPALPVPVSPSSMYIEPPPEEKERRRIAKGKQKAVDFEIEPPIKVSRTKSIRRFFTTNPSSSSSSSTSSRRSKHSRGASSGSRELPQIREHGGPVSVPVSSLRTTIPISTKTYRPLPKPGLPITEKGVNHVRFTTANLNQSVPTTTTKKMEVEYMGFEPPPRRIDKGKERAYD